MLLLQKYLPQHLMSRAMGWLTNISNQSIKNALIRTFMRRYQVDLQQFDRTNIDDYHSFNDFFTRALADGARPITTEPTAIASPVDGTVSQLGNINKQTIFQVKQHPLRLDTLLASNSLATKFDQGKFITLYLAPEYYHRVHMPLTGKLRTMTYIPGQLFSVNARTVTAKPDIFANNERLVCLFEHELGQFAVIMVGAIFVGSMQTSWAGTITPPYGDKLVTVNYEQGINLQRGMEMGRFNMGSTVILLLEQNFQANLTQAIGTMAKVGASIGQIYSND